MPLNFGRLLESLTGDVWSRCHAASLCSQVGLLAETQTMDSATMGTTMGHLLKLNKLASIGGKISELPRHIK